MPLFNNLLRELVAKSVDAAITVRYHTGDPGTNGTANLLGSSDLSIPGPQIAAGASGWTLDATLGRATRTAVLSFGNAQRAITGISHISMVKGGAVIGTRALVEAFDAELGAPVSLTGGTLILNVTSTDS